MRARIQHAVDNPEAYFILMYYKDYREQLRKQLSKRQETNN